MTKELANTIVNLVGNDKKLLYVNDRYYCQLCIGSHLDGHNMCDTFFSEPKKDENSPSIFQRADMYVLDMNLDKGHHSSGFGTIVYAYHPDMTTEQFKHTLTLYLPDNFMTIANTIEVVDAPYDIKEFMKMIDVVVEHPLTNPIEAIEGVEFISLVDKNEKSASIEYYINGNIYCEIVDFSHTEQGDVIPIDSAKRNIVIAYQKLTKDNACEFAQKINDALKSM